MRKGRRNYSDIKLAIEGILKIRRIELICVVDILIRMLKRKRLRRADVGTYSIINKMPHQIVHMNRLVGVTDTNCIDNLRMDRNTFGRLCLLLREMGGLKDGKYVSVEEQVAMFLGVLAHHKKNRVIRFDFWRSGQTVSFYLHVVLKAILKQYSLLLVKPEPVPEDSIDHRWKWFKGCLGALDGTYINCTVPNVDKPRYRSRKGQICTNTLGVCDRNLRWIYVLTGWEGSAADSRVLRDAVNRVHGLRVPRGNYYLCDNGYANSEGFLAPYRGVRYHLEEWGQECEVPRNSHEMFNMRHAKARNVVERAFGIMKMRWGILRAASYYPVKVHNQLIMACFLLHNFIRNEMHTDPIELEMDETNVEVDGGNDEPDIDFVDAIENSIEWNNIRDNIAQTMWTSQ